MKNLKRQTFILCCFGLLFTSQFAKSQNHNGVFSNTDKRSTVYIAPTRVLWTNAPGGAKVDGEKNLLRLGIGQADLGNSHECYMQNSDTVQTSILLDFGRELQGGLRIVTGQSKTRNPQIRIRYGESVSEAMSDINDESGATNDHAIRDFVVTLPWLGRLDTGSSGFRFVRIDLLGANTKLTLKEVNAAYTFNDIPYYGSFECSDTLLNNIWKTGAYTAHLNLQNYLWDGIKRDRLVWAGDMYPEVMTIGSVFGLNDVVKRSLDLNRDLYPVPQWMNGISSYSIWWMLCHYQLYMYGGDKAYLNEQKTYILQLLNTLISKIGSDGKENLDGGRFLDWPSSENKQGVNAGLQALMVIAMQRGAELCSFYGDKAMAMKCRDAEKKLLQYVPDCNNSKQAASLMALAGLMKPDEADSKYITKNGAHGFSTFYGYFMLEAMAKANDYQQAMDIMKTYWGGMLALGATTFWEDFDIDWMKNAGRIDEMPQPDKVDVHRTYGAYCYKKLRHSLCHGWASGPTTWLSEHILGIEITKPGCREVTIEPHLGSLSWARGSFPTPYGVIKVEHKKNANGKITTKYTAPKEIKVTIK
jgi:alpha-L-rhamnosidase